MVRIEQYLHHDHIVSLTRVEVLGITSGASKAEIKKAYHKVRYLINTFTLLGTFF